MRNVDNKEFFHSISIDRHGAVSGRGAPIVSNDGDIAGAERFDQGKQIALGYFDLSRDQGFLWDGAWRTNGLTARVPLRGDPWTKIVPGVRPFRKAMQHAHKLPPSLPRN